MHRSLSDSDERTYMGTWSRITRESSDLMVLALGCYLAQANFATHVQSRLD